jgi:uncharacterized membrane protein YfcA
MLEMGVLPPVAAASAGTMILFTSAAASVAFYTFSLIPLDYGCVCVCLGFCVTYIGQKMVGHMLKKYQKESLIVLSIGYVILLSAVLMGVQSVVDMVENPAEAVKGGHLCG